MVSIRPVKTACQWAKTALCAIWAMLTAISCASGSKKPRFAGAKRGIILQTQVCVGSLANRKFVEESNLLVLNKLERLLTVCKVKNIDDIDLSKEFYFIGKTDEEISLVCETNDVPENTIEREDGWRGFRIQ